MVKDQQFDALVRPLRQALIEIGVFSMVTCLLTAGLAWQDPEVQRLGWAGVPAWFTSAGKVLALHAGWYYGVLIPLLLGFYAFIAGGQLLGVPHVQQSRRHLGIVAELLAAATSPVFLVLMGFGILHASERTLVMVLLPVQAVVLFLGAQLGGFIVFGRDERHRAAVASAEAARTGLASVGDRSRSPWWLTLLAHAVIVGCVSWAAAAAVLYVKPILATWPLLGALAILAAVIGALFIGAEWLFRAATDRVSRAVAWFVPYGVVLFLILAAVSQPSSRVAVAIDAALGVQLVVAVLSTHVRGSRQWWRDWSLGGAGRRIAAQEITRRYAGAMREARATRAAPAADRTLVAGIKKWMQAALS